MLVNKQTKKEEVIMAQFIERDETWLKVLPLTQTENIRSKAIRK